jgi:ankyrin repeat protein
MSAPVSTDLQNSASENLASQSDHPPRLAVLPPFCETFSVDKELKLSCENFKLWVDSSLKHKDLTPISQLTATPPFPSPYVLAQFASKTYTDYETEETDSQYETRLALPDGWKLLTTASNSKNGYFGAAYWHPEHQQVVIAHRGTDRISFADLCADIFGVVFQQHVQQISSASTFAHEVFEVLREVDQEKGTKFQLFFTGHSLGGWLAQVTTFATEYLKIEGNILIKNDHDNDSDYYHPHTVVFDSPGCKETLLKMMDTFDVRLEGRSMNTEDLDITSYLSAPNRINTCNTHLGTVYRILTDLSDMGWWKKNTALYNIAVHSIDRIVEAFDPETGQVRKNEQGQQNVHVVIDWPISTGLGGGEEYNKFFACGKDSNSYCPDIRDETAQQISHQLIRYQTKMYDELVNSISIFSKGEQEFLQSYSILRQFLKFCDLKELFSPMEINQAQEEAENMLQNYEIKNDKIRCRDASALHALIPYVKRLLRLFPQIKENTKSALSSDKIMNKFCRLETSRTIKEITHSPLEIQPDAFNFGEFLNAEKQVLQLQVVDGDAWTGLVMVHQVLEKNCFLRKDQYGILTLECFLKEGKVMDLSKLIMSIEEQYLLLMACGNNLPLNDEAEDIIRKLFVVIKRKPKIKIILSTRSEGSAANFLQRIGKDVFDKGFVTRYEQLTWGHITADLQEKFLQQKVNIQGGKYFLNELMSAESPVANVLPLTDLLEEKELIIGDSVPNSRGYNEGYYVGRTLRHQKAIKWDIFSDKDVKGSHVYLASTEQEYKEICKKNPKSSVHWLVKEDPGKLIWKKTQGSLETVRRYIDTKSFKEYTPDDIDMLLEQAQQQRVMIISDIAGMGKSTLLTHLSKQIKAKFPAKWVVRIELNNHRDVLKLLKTEDMDKKKAIDFVAEKLLKLKSGLELELFKQSCEQNQKVRIVIMLDGFDEISPLYKDTVIALLQSLEQTTVEQLWVTTRPHLRRELEDKLQRMSYTIDSFSDKNQVEFLTNFWSLEDWFTQVDKNKEEENKKKLESYAKILISELAQSISGKDTEFTGIPLQCRMLADAFDKEVRTFFRSTELAPNLRLKLDLLGLYGRFIERKYDIFLQEKCHYLMNTKFSMEQRERDLRRMRRDHQLLALKLLFTEEQVEMFQNDGEYTLSTEELTRIGIVQISYEGKPHFIHSTFAEYFVADCLVEQLNKRDVNSQTVQNFILKDIFQKADYRVMRIFVDGLMSRSGLSETVLKEYGDGTHYLGKVAEQTLHVAAREGNANIVEFLLDSLGATKHKDTLVKLLQAEDKNRRTAFFLAATWCNVHALKVLWERGKKYLTREQLCTTYLLAQDVRKNSAWHVAAEEGHLEVITQLWEWASNVMPGEELNNKLLLVKDGRNNTAFHIAAKKGRTEVFQAIWQYAKDRLTTEELNNNVLLPREKYGQTVWHCTIRKGKVNLLQELWKFAEENLTTQELNNKLLLAKNNREQTALHVAAECGNVELVRKLCEWAEEKLKPEDLKQQFLLAKEKKGQTAWHVAAEWGNLEILQKLLKWAKRVLPPEEINDNSLLDRDGNGQTFLHVAATRTNTMDFEQLWYWTTKNLTTEEIKELVFSKDDHEQTVLQEVKSRLNPEVYQTMRDWVRRSFSTEYDLND